MKKHLKILGLLIVSFVIFYQDDKGSVQTLYSRMLPTKETVEFTNVYKEVQYAEYCFSIESPTATDLMEMESTKLLI